MGLIIEIPLYTIIAVVKSPYLLIMGWYRLLHDLVSREGPFLETACIPIAGLAILLWPLIVVGSILLSVFSSIFIGLYGAIIVYQERSFRRGLAYIVAMVAEFDEYTNDLLYLREGSILPKPRYRSKKSSHAGDFSVGSSRPGKFIAVIEAPAMLIANLAPSRSVRETIQEVKMVQIWEHIMRSCVLRGKELVDANIILPADLDEWSRVKGSIDITLVGVGLPSYSLMQTLLDSIAAGAGVLKEQIKVINLSEGELRFLEKVVLFGTDTRRMETWDNGSIVPDDALRTAQIQGISRRLMGMTRSLSKFPTYRRRFSRVVKTLVAYSLEKSSSIGSMSPRSAASIVLV
ncbi:hypothetical protein C5167_010974 [Papaver somniferum]|uniref:Uncharacterized protein n=1 Tax=Papaver somniferum TaxID=3469 RepID=A0A4Y7K1P1_PAPSO|nr:hypothetical protein C5167_010974 [Papaver somniferum]